MFACLYSVFKVPPADSSAVTIPFQKRSSGDGEIRTHDPLLARQVLSQLSYTPTGVPTANAAVTIIEHFLHLSKK